MDQKKKWLAVIRPKTGWFDIDLKEVWRYRDLVKMFVKRDFVTFYKQTVLGPLWFIINPVLTTLVFTVVFGGIAGLAPGGVPSFLFYMAGNTVWAYFATCLTNTSSTFTANANIFGKVYFPRLTMPISTVVFALISFGVQFVLFIILLVIMMLSGAAVAPNLWILLTPLLILEMAMLGLGVGIIVSSLTTKYRDLQMLVAFGVQLWMYATPVVYDYATVKAMANVPQWLKTAYMLNPMAPIVETFRYAYLGVGAPQPMYLAISAVTTLVLLAIGVILFSRVEKTFMDTV